MRDFNLFCAGCAWPMSYQRAWREPLSKALVCGKECLDKVQLDYCGMIVVKVADKSYPNPDACRPIPWASYMYDLNSVTDKNWMLARPYSLDSQLPAHYAACRDCKSTRFCICPPTTTGN